MRPRDGRRSEKDDRSKGGAGDRPHDRPRARRPDRLRLLPLFDEHGGARPGAAAEVSAATGVPESHAYGTATFFHLLARPDVEARVCTGTSCRLAGATELLAALQARGVAAEGCACLAQCDQAPAVLLPVAGQGGHYRPYRAALAPNSPPALPAAPALRPLADWLMPGERGAVLPADPSLPIDLGAVEDPRTAFAAFDRAFAPGEGRGASWVLDELQASGLRGRGGAGFPAHLKWRAVAKHRPAVGVECPPARRPIVICNADEGEPGTFKDREIALRRPMALLEGMAIAAAAIGADELIIYLRGEQGGALECLQRALASLRAAGRLADRSVEIALGHGAYICGEETALLEALEGRRGMPRHKPPFPTDAGYLGRPTLLSNVETFAAVPGILRLGGAAVAARGIRGGVGLRLWSISGDVGQPGVYELPVGTTLRELIAVAGGMLPGRTLLAFVPGGAASGVLPGRYQDIPLGGVQPSDGGPDPLAALGSMAGSGGVIVLDDRRDVAELVADSLGFFRDESCGQCAPCRIGTQVLAQSFDRWRRALAHGPEIEAPAFTQLVQVADDVGWEMGEGSICGLGQAAHLPLQHYLRDFAAGRRRAVLGSGAGAAAPTGGSDAG